MAYGHVCAGSKPEQSDDQQKETSQAATSVCQKHHFVRRPDIALARGMPLGFADSIFGFARGNVHDELGKLVGIARRFGHEASMPQVSG